MSASTDRSSGRPINWAVTATVFFVGSVLLWADRTNFSVAAAAWAKEYGWTPSTIGVMLSAFSLGYLILQPVGGWIADKAGARRTLAGAMAGWSLWVLLTPIAPTVLWLTATFRVLLGAFEGPYIPASVAAVARAIPLISKRGRFSAFVQSGAQLGPAAGVFFAGVILSATGSPVWIFVIFGVIGLVGAAAWWIYARNFDDPVPQGAHAETAEAKKRAAQGAAPFWPLLTTAALWPFYIGYFALPYCQYLFLTWLPQYLSHYRHIPLIQASALSALPFLVAFFAVNFAGWGMDWLAAAGWTKGAFHRKSFIALGAIIYACTTLIAATTESNTLAVTMIIIANAGLSFYVIPYWTTCTDIAPNQTGTLSGLMNYFGILGATLSPFLTGVIAQATGAFVAPLVLAVCIMLAASATMILFFRYRPLSELNFSDRACRSEYWYWVLFVTIGVIVAKVIDAAIGVSVIYLIFAAVVFLPTVAIGVLRLHDLDRSGWWLLLGLIPLVGAIVLIVWFCRKGTDGPNRFGPDPLAVAPPIRQPQAA